MDYKYAIDILQTELDRLTVARRHLAFYSAYRLYEDVPGYVQEIREDITRDIDVIQGAIVLLYEHSVPEMPPEAVEEG